MSDHSSIAIPCKTAHLAKRLARSFPKRKLARTARMMGPTLVALAFAGLTNTAYAQGTMDFSGANGLLNNFNWRNDYVGVEQWSRNIIRDRYVHLVPLHEQLERFAQMWDDNLRLQDFLEAFTDAAIRG